MPENKRLKLARGLPKIPARPGTKKSFCHAKQAHDRATTELVQCRIVERIG
jgi:hypothetical protein